MGADFEDGVEVISTGHTVDSQGSVGAGAASKAPTFSPPLRRAPPPAFNETDGAFKPLPRKPERQQAPSPPRHFHTAHTHKKLPLNYEHGQHGDAETKRGGAAARGSLARSGTQIASVSLDKSGGKPPRRGGTVTDFSPGADEARSDK
jgi:hypothetical protein